MAKTISNLFYAFRKMTLLLMAESRKVKVFLTKGFSCQLFQYNE